MAWSSISSGTSAVLFDAWGASTSDVWAAGEDQTFIHWNGSSWTTNFSQSAQTFNAVFGFSSSDVWQVATGGVIEHWNGSMWLRVSSGVGVTLRSVWGAASNDLWAVGDSGTIIHWNGSTWSTSASGTGQNLLGVWGAASNDVWAVGGLGTILHWNGSAWSASASGTTNILRGVWGAATNDVWAIGDSGTIKHWNGAVWSTSTSGTVNDLRGVWGHASNDVWAVGITNGVAGTILHWNGAAWSASTSGTADSIFGVWGFASNDVWVVTSGSAPRHWNGATWSAAATGGAANAVWGFASNDVWVAGLTSFFGQHQRHWDGSSWFLGQNIITGVWGLAANDIWAVGYNGILRHWDGGNWSPVAINIAGSWKFDFNAVWGNASNDVWAAAGGGGPGSGYLVHWNGSSWSLSTTLASDDCFAMWGFASNDIWAAGNGPNFAHWDGGSWNLVAKPAGQTTGGLWGAATNDVWAVGNAGKIFHWNGATWSTVPSGTLVDLDAVWGFATDDVWAAGGTTILHWDGASWATVPNGAAQTLRSLWGAAPNELWVVGSFGTTLRWLTQVTRRGYFGKSVIQYPFDWGISLALPKAISRSGQGQLADGSCLVFGGVDSTDFQVQVISDAYLIAPDGSSVAPVDPVPFTFPDARSTLLGDGRLLVVAGGGATATFSGTSWAVQSSSLLVGTGDSLVTLPNGNGFLMDGGSNGCQEYDASSDGWANRASTQTLHFGGTATVLPATNEIFLCSMQGSGFRDGVPEIYDIDLDTWSFPVNSPQAENFCQTQVLLPNGKLFTCSTGTGFQIVADLYDPDTRLFTPLPSLANSLHSQTLVAYPPNGFFLGENLIAVFSTGSQPRVAWFNYSKEQWFGGGFDANPDYTYNGESMPSPSNLFYLGQPGATLGFIVLGFETQNFGFFTPHVGGFYIERSQAPVNNSRASTFNGTVTVEQGLTADRVFLTWNAGSDPLTNFRDLNYYACAVDAPGDEDFNSPNNSTEIWAGSVSMEVRDLFPGITHWFQVAVRNMLGPNQPGTINFQGVSPEVSFLPRTPGTPLSVGSWRYTASMIQSRSGPAGAYLSEGRYLVWGGGTDTGANSTLGDIYSQSGLEVLTEPNAPLFAEGATVDASPRTYGTPTGISGFHLATSSGGLDQFGNTQPSTHEYFPYVGGWNEGRETTSPHFMNEAVYRHAMVQFPFGGLLRIGGMTVAGDVTSTTNTVELFTLGVVNVAYFGLVSPFTVGEDVVGLFSGASGKILSDTPGLSPGFGVLTIQPYSDLQFESGDTLLDTLSGQADFASVEITPFEQTWSFVSSMTQARAQHSAICLNGYSMRLTALSAPFSVGEVITQVAFGGATATVVAVLVTSGDGNDTVLELSHVAPTANAFVRGAHITGNMGGDGFVNGYDVYRSQKVLVVGGNDALGNPVSTAEVYDGRTDTWTGPIGTSAAHYLFPMVMRTDGRPLAIGGGTAVTEYYDPDAGTFTPIAPLPAAKTEHTAHVFSSAHVGVFGGRSAGSSNQDQYSSVWGTSTTDVWVVGNSFSGQGVIRHWNGTAWTTTRWPSVSRWNSVFGFTTTDVWVVGSAGGAMHWDGGSWTDFSTGDSTALNCVFGVAGGELWAIGEAGTIYRWDGFSWNSQTSPTGQDLNDMEGVHVGETINYVAVGLAGTIIQTTDAITWNVIQPGLTGEDLFSIARFVAPAFNLWICGDNGTTFRSTGGAFSSFANGLGFGSTMTHVRGTTSSDVWMVGSNGNEVAHWNGSAWTAVTPFTADTTTFNGLMVFPIPGSPPLDRYVWAVGEGLLVAAIWFFDAFEWVFDGSGNEPAGVVNSVLLYDPDADIWNFQLGMNEARARHVSFLMPNNKVLVVGGEDNSAIALDSAEISPGSA